MVDKKKCIGLRLEEEKKCSEEFILDLIIEAYTVDPKQNLRAECNEIMN